MTSAVWETGRRSAFWICAMAGAFAILSSWLWLGAVLDDASQDQGRADPGVQTTTVGLIGYAPLVVVHMAAVISLTALGAKWRKDSFTGVLIALSVSLIAVIAGAALTFSLWSPRPYVP